MSHFVPTVVYTNELADKMKAGEIDFRTGQWFWSKKFNNKGRYIGTYLTVYNGVVAPYVHISWPKQGERLVDWNKRFLEEKAEAIHKHKMARKLPRVGEYKERPTPTIIDTVETDLDMFDALNEIEIPAKLNTSLLNYYPENEHPYDPLNFDEFEDDDVLEEHVVKRSWLRRFIDWLRK